MKIKLTPDSYQEFIFPVRETAKFIINGFVANHADCDFTHCYFTDNARMINQSISKFIGKAFITRVYKEYPCLKAIMNGTIEVEIVLLDD